MFFDIDGTILSEKTGRIPDSVVPALKAARKNGHLLFINTGRTWCSVPDEIKALDMDGFLCGCGTYLVYHDRVLFENHIPAQRGREIIDKLYECNLDAVMEGTKDIYFPKNISRFEWLERSREYFEKRGLSSEKFAESDIFEYDKLFLYADDKSDVETFFKYIQDELIPIRRMGEAYEVAQKAYSKAGACEYIRKKFGMGMEQVYVFGDSRNDLTMFEYAEHAIAMGDHSEALEPYTEFVTKTVEEDGIAYALDYYGFSK